jgi:DNA segregation ATPase FtsK/SpoIIIE, S-DNA-T family
MMRRDPYRYYRRAMRRNWRTRHGLYPLFIPPPYEREAPLIIAMLGRLLYRHRSAFLPFLITGTTFALAYATHRHHPGSWPIAATATFTATLILAIPHQLAWPRPATRKTSDMITRAWEACGIARPAERAYAATVTAVTGGWLTAAIAAGPTAKPLPTIAAIATVILGIPWWAHRRRRARVRIERTIQSWPDIAENMGLPGSRIASATGDAWGFTARVILRKGTTTAQAIGQIPAIESGLGMRPGSVRALPDPKRADRFILRAIETDPHAQPVPWPGQPDTSITRPAALGLFEDGQPACVTLLRRNALIGGTTGSGKSGVLNVILAYLAACADVAIWGIDLKGGMELQPWAGCLDRLATTPPQAIRLFDDAITELDKRAATMAAHSRRVWDPAPGTPALVIVVDEYAELPADARDSADSLARRGRAVAVNLLAATQRPTQQAMGSNAVRSQMDTRICLRVRERRDVDLILGQGSLASGWHAHTLTQPGAFLLSDPEHTTPQPARGYLITDGQVASHVRAHARPALASTTPPGPTPPYTAPAQPGGTDGQEAPETALWDALRAAGPEGVTARALARHTRMGRTWVYERLREHADVGRACHVSHGHWRAAGPGQSDR